MADNNGNNKDKSKLTTALTTAAQPGEKRGGGLLGALGGKAPATISVQKIQQVDKKTISTLATVQKTARSGTAGHMAYVIDATGSRADTWAQAQKIQSDMFREAGKAGDLTVRLVHFGGHKVSDKGWFDNAHKLVSTMSEVSCEGGMTQINESIDKILSSEKLPRNIVLIGDCYEEDDAALTHTIARLAACRIKVFAFLDVLDGQGNGEHAYRKIAEKTGGSFQYFGRDMNLKALCEAVAAYTTGGDDALKKLAQTSKEAKAISAQVLRLSGPSAPKP